MRTVFLEKFDKETVYLDSQEQHHLTKVLRKTSGYEFIGFDGKGSRFRCRLDRRGNQWFGDILEELNLNLESQLNLHLAQALVKKDRFEWVLQKTVELGISRITPIITWRTEVELTAKRMDKHFLRWKKILLEAVKQCGRNLIPILDQPVELEIFLNRSSDHPKLVLDEDGNEDMSHWIDQRSKIENLTLFIGPEGGWDAHDRRFFDQHGISRVTLGPRILRTETAAVAAVSVLQYLHGDLSNPSG